VDLLIATKNETKKNRYQVILNPLNVNLLNLEDVGIDFDVEETGANPETIAADKALVYFSHARIPCISIDYGMTIDNFPKHVQPGASIRRIPTIVNRRPTDKEMLNYYIENLKKYGGSSEATLITGLSVCKSDGNVNTTKFTKRVKFVTTPCKKTDRGQPLNSIRIEPTTGKYYAELSMNQRAKLGKENAKIILDFVKQTLNL
jgi:inosine/xanthosine triphosphate pyrophosphatase family protein